jgi:hypothetical protein
MLKKDLRKLIEGTSDAAYVVNSGGVVVAWNKAAFIRRFESHGQLRSSFQMSFST